MYKIRGGSCKENKVRGDRGTWLLDALRTQLQEWSNAESIYCIRHLASNFNKKFRDPDLKDKGDRVAEVEAPSRSGGRHSKVYGLEFQSIGNKEYCPSYYGPSFIPNPIMRRKRTGRSKTTRIHNEMDEVEPQLIK
ncbi:hypothetical protein Lal_00008231 [Lupinus albus]|nr:hypothetical protein Lal_00008231 [Lupinus albus]